MNHNSALVSANRRIPRNSVDVYRSRAGAGDGSLLFTHETNTTRTVEPPLCGWQRTEQSAIDQCAKMTDDRRGEGGIAYEQTNLDISIERGLRQVSRCNEDSLVIRHDSLGVEDSRR